MAQRTTSKRMNWSRTDPYAGYKYVPPTAAGRSGGGSSASGSSSTPQFKPWKVKSKSEGYIPKGGYYNPKTGVFTSQTGQQSSMASAPPGATVPFQAFQKQQTQPSAAGKSAAGGTSGGGSYNPDTKLYTSSTGEQFSTAVKPAGAVIDKTITKTAPTAAGKTASGTTTVGKTASPFPEGTTPQQISRLSQVSQRDVDYAVSQAVTKEQTTWGGLPHEEFQERKVQREAELTSQYETAIETAKQVKAGTYEEPIYEEQIQEAPQYEQQGIITYTGFQTETPFQLPISQPSISQPSIIEPIIQTSTIQTDSLPFLPPTDRTLLTGEDLQAIYEQEQEEKERKGWLGWGELIESAIIEPIQKGVESVYDIIKPEETYVVEEKYAAGQPAGYIVGYEPAMKEGVPYQKPIVEYSPVLLSRTEERLGWKPVPTTEFEKSAAITSQVASYLPGRMLTTKEIRGIVSAAPALALFATDIGRTAVRVVTNPLSAPNIVGKKLIGIGTGFYTGIVENPELFATQFVGSVAITGGLGKIIPVKYQLSTYVGKGARYVTSKLPVKIQVKFPIKLQTFKGERLFADQKLTKYTKTYKPPPKFLRWKQISEYGGIPDSMRITYKAVYSDAPPIIKTYLRRVATKPVPKTKIWGKQILDTELVVKGKKGIDAFDPTERASFIFKEKTGTYATPKDILRLKDIRKRVSGHDVQRIQHIVDKIDDSTIWRTNIEVGRKLRIESPLIETKLSRAVKRPKIDLGESRPLSGRSVTELKLALSDVGKGAQSTRYTLELFTKEAKKIPSLLDDSGGRLVKSSMSDLARQKSFNKFIKSFEKKAAKEVTKEVVKDSSTPQQQLRDTVTVSDLPILKPVEIFPDVLPQTAVNIPTARYAIPLLTPKKKLEFDSEDTFKEYVRISESASSPLTKSKFGTLGLQSEQYKSIGIAWAIPSLLLKGTKAQEKLALKQVEITKPDVKIKTDTKTDILLGQRQAQLLGQKQMQMQQQAMRTLLRQESVPYRPYPPEVYDVPEPPPPIIYYGDDDKKKSRLSSLLGYDVFIKTRRKTGFREFEDIGFKKISKKSLTRKSALGLGAYKTRRSPAMTFFITKSKLPGIKTDFEGIWKSDKTKFRRITGGKGKSYFVQTRESAIGTPEEIEAISLLGAETRRKSALDFKSVL